MKLLSPLFALFIISCADEGIAEDLLRFEVETGAAELDVSQAPMRLVATGYGFTEGPAWFSDLGVLRFTDLRASRIHELDPPSGITIWREDTGKTNGLGVTPSQQLIASESGNRRVTRFTDSDTFVVVAAAYNGSALNGPNDNVVRSDGNIYFTDPNWMTPPGGQELPFQGVFRVSPIGMISLVDAGLENPNGIALSPDESRLYVVDTPARKVYVYNVAPDGSTGPRASLVDTEGGPDGMAVDDNGNLYVTSVAGIDVYRPNGTYRRTISVPEKPANCTFGGADRRTLYIAAGGSLYSIRQPIPGLP